MIQTVPVSKPTSEDLPITVGIDVSKDHLDAARYPSGETIRVANTQKDHAVLLRWINKRSKINRVVFEATGPYHRNLERRLITAGIPFALPALPEPRVVALPASVADGTRWLPRRLVRQAADRLPPHIRRPLILAAVM